MKAILVAGTRVSVVVSAGGKTAVFGVLKRHGRVYKVIVKDTK